MGGAKKPLPEELSVIEELKRADYEYEVDEPGWGFHHLNDDALAQVRKLKTIAFLDLFEKCDSGGVTDQGLAHLAQNRSLVCLRLGPGITDEGLTHLADLVQLEELRLDSAEAVTDAGMRHLAKLTNLEVLSLQFTQVGDAGLEQLAGLSRLRSLVLLSTRVTDAAVPTLIRLRSLTELEIGMTGITKKGLETLRAALPECSVTES
jgi:hypothetical protein